MMMNTLARHAPDRASLQQGMALLEALIAIVLFSLGVLGIVALQARATQFSADAEDRSRAAMFANELAARMWEQRSANLDAATINAWKATVQASGSGLPGADASSSYVADGEIATITISWRAPWRKSGEQTNSYSTQVVIP